MTPTVLIYEHRPRWVPELQRQFLREEVRVRGCATLKDLEHRLTSSLGGVAVLELDAAPSECLQVLGRWMVGIPSPRVIVVCSARFRDLEWAIRELGAIAVLEEPIPGDEMAAWCRRQFSSDAADL